MIVTFPGVYAPRSDTRLMQDAMAEQGLPLDAPWLDVCSGTGALAIAAAQLGATDVTAVDVSRRAVRNIAINAALTGVTVRALRGDLFAPVAGRRFGVIVSNPPYLPARRATGRGAARAWDAGLDGRALLDRICASARDHLLPGGTLLLVQSSLADVRLTQSALEAHGLEVRAVGSHVGPLGPIAAARSGFLRDLGLLTADGLEELVVLRADAVEVPALAA
jgi:release factor glutamine methyltransferase